MSKASSASSIVLYVGLRCFNSLFRQAGPENDDQMNSNILKNQNTQHWIVLLDVIILIVVFIDLNIFLLSCILY